jgi:hypothetical protein
LLSLRNFSTLNCRVASSPFLARPSFCLGPRRSLGSPGSWHSRHSNFSIPTCFDREQFDFSEKLKHFAVLRSFASWAYPKKKSRTQQGPTRPAQKGGEKESRRMKIKISAVHFGMWKFSSCSFSVVLAFNGTRCLCVSGVFRGTQRTGHIPLVEKFMSVLEISFLPPFPPRLVPKTTSSSEELQSKIAQTSLFGLVRPSAAPPLPPFATFR